MRRVTFSQWLQILLIVGVGVLVWQIILLRHAVKSIDLSPSGPLQVEVVNDVKLDTLSPIEVEVTNAPDVTVTNEVDANITNPELDVHTSNLPY